MGTPTTADDADVREGARGRETGDEGSCGATAASTGLPYLTLEGLLGQEKRTETVPLGDHGAVVVRELDAGELLECHVASFEENPLNVEEFRMNPSKFMMAKVAAALETPSLGPDCATRILRMDELRSIPSSQYERIAGAVELLNNCDLSEAVRLSNVIDSLPWLFEVLNVLAHKNAWLDELPGKTQQEFNVWIGFYKAYQARSERALAAIQAR